ncbi:MAG: tannase/feruloyl esterase family alpha/beta hydrolase, partial [Syntrophomonadaceae bacterium]
MSFWLKSPISRPQKQVILRLDLPPGRGRSVFSKIIPEFYRVYPDFNLKIYQEVLREDNGGSEILSCEYKLQDGIRYALMFGVIHAHDPEAPDIQWKILLPSIWNGRTVQMGGGANNGVIPDVEGSLILSDEIAVTRSYI